jgi:hypothetical protein
VKLGGLPSEFLKQTPRSFVICMEGMAHAANRQIDIGILTAWHAITFYGAASSGKLAGKKLSDFLTSVPKPTAEDEQREEHARAINFFLSQKARGVPVEITRH